MGDTSQRTSARARRVARSLRRIQRNAVPLYKTWSPDWEDGEHPEEYGALDVKRAAQLHASYLCRTGDAYSWPMCMHVINPQDGRTYQVEVHKRAVIEYVGCEPELVSP